MTISYWGVEHGDSVYKAWGDRNRKPSERSVMRRPTTMNTRGQNAATGATVGAAEYGALGAGLGALAARGRTTVKHGKYVTAAPTRAARLKTAGKAGAATAVIGAGLGGAMGAVFPNKNSAGAKRTTNYADRQFGIKQDYKKKKNQAFSNYMSGR